MFDSGVMERAITRWLMRPVRVSTVERLSSHFRLIGFSGESLQAATWSAGHKIRMKLAGGLHTRTYTPIAWDGPGGATQILVYAHGAGPGSDWVTQARVGAECQFLGPRRSMDLENLPKKTILFGDETSFGLAAAVQAQAADDQDIHYAFEVSSLAESRPILRGLGLDASIVARRLDDWHLNQVKDLILPLIDDATHFLLSGKAQSIQFLSRALKQLGFTPGRLRTKAYWAPGKRGLD